LIKTNFPDIRAIRLSNYPENPSKHHSSPIKFEMNEVVEAKVLRLLSQNKALLIIKGKQVVAKTQIPLQEGRTFYLITDSVSPILSLKPLGFSHSLFFSPNISLVLSAIKENLWGAIIGKKNALALPEKTILHLRTLIQELSLAPFTRITPEFLKRFIEKSGLNWEAKLKKAIHRKAIHPEDIRKLAAGDLKGLASKLMALDKKNKPLEHFISFIKHVQLLNQKDSHQGIKCFIPIPVQYTDSDFTVARLLIQLPGKNSNKSGKLKQGQIPVRISLYMELTYLGPIYTEVFLMGKKVTGKFILIKPEAQMLIEEKIPELIDQLKEKGYTASNIICSVVDPDFIEQTLMADLIQPEDTFLDVVI